MRSALPLTYSHNTAYLCYYSLTSSHDNKTTLTTTTTTATTTATTTTATATAAAAAAAATATAAAAAAEWGRGVVDAERRRLEAAESQKRQSELAAIALDEARARRVAFSYTKRMQVLPLFAMSLSIACEVV
jgi:hypothetical protein